MKGNRSLRHAAALLSLTAIASTAMAQYTGPGARDEAALATLRTVAAVLEAPVDDQQVVLTGTIVQQTGRETFLFRDGTGEIQVEIDREDFPPGKSIGADTRVVIHGEVDTRALRAPEIDVEQIRLSPAAAGP